MDSAIIGALFGIVFLTIVNICVVSYSYGRLSQKVTDLCRRVLKLEGLHNNKGGK